MADQHQLTLNERLARGLQQAAEGSTHNLGDFTQHLDERDMADRLPAWVIDLVIALQKHETVHAKDSTCRDPLLALVPADVRQQAEAVHAYALSATS